MDLNYNLATTPTAFRIYKVCTSFDDCESKSTKIRRSIFLRQFIEGEGVRESAVGFLGAKIGILRILSKVALTSKMWELPRFEYKLT